jgi:hypothetical protein
MCRLGFVRLQYTPTLDLLMWSQLTFASASTESPCGRSSHSLTALNIGGRRRALLLGGESAPRVAIDVADGDAAWLLDVNADAGDRVSSTRLSFVGDALPSLLGHTSVAVADSGDDNDVALLFGGRLSGALGEVTQFADVLRLRVDVAAGSITVQSLAVRGDAPSARSYHCADSDGSKMFIYGVRTAPCCCTRLLQRRRLTKINDAGMCR